jgi:hypothetical protein
MLGVQAGLPLPLVTDPWLAWLLALATQKLIADIATGAYQYSRNQVSNTSFNNPIGNLGTATVKSQLKYQFHQIQDATPWKEGSMIRRSSTILWS